MALANPERITVDGVDVKTLAVNTASLGGLLRAPGKRGGNVPTAGRSGALWTPQKPFEENTVVLPFRVRGADHDGRVPAGSTSRREFQGRLDELVALFTKAHALLDVRHLNPAGTWRQVFAECTNVIDWTTVGPMPLARVDVELTFPDPFWCDPASSTLLSVGANVATVFGAGATAPLEDAVITFTGPQNNPLVTDSVGGGYLRYGATLAAGATVTFDCAAWTMTTTGGASADLGLLNFSGTGGRLMRFAPDPVARGYKAILQGASSTAATNLRVVGRAKYLTG